jgi:hypothetical protein
MHIVHISTIKHTNGAIVIDLIVVGDDLSKERKTYNLDSEFMAGKFHALLKLGNELHSSALELLNKVKIVPQPQALMCGKGGGENAG